MRTSVPALLYILSHPRMSLSLRGRKRCIPIVTTVITASVTLLSQTVNNDTESHGLKHDIAAIYVDGLPGDVPGIL